MKNIYVLLLAGIILIVSACSMKTLKRAGYETLQNVQMQQCQDELSSNCPERVSYETYQRKVKGLEDPQK